MTVLAVFALLLPVLGCSGNSANGFASKISKRSGLHFSGSETVSGTSLASDELKFLNMSELEDYLANYLYELLGDSAGKSASVPPTNPANAVDDLTYTSGPGPGVTFTWHYRNIGDYGQDGIADIADIAPVAEHFFDAFDEGSQTWPHPADEAIDGNGDKKIDIADIAPLAENFFNQVDGYVLEESPDGTTFTEVARAALADLKQPSEGRLLLSFYFDAPQNNAFYRVRPYQTGVTTLGTPSNQVQYIAGANGIILILVTPPIQGDGTESSPYEINTNTPYELRVETILGVDVSADAQISANPPFIPTISDTVPRTLTVDGLLTGDFAVQATLPGDEPLESNTLWFRVVGLPE